MQHNLPDEKAVPAKPPRLKKTTTTSLKYESKESIVQQKRKKQLQFQSPLTNTAKFEGTWVKNVSNVCVTLPAAAAAAATKTTKTLTNVASVSTTTTSTAPASNTASTRNAISSTSYQIVPKLLEKTRLTQGCSSLMHACQHGKMELALEILRSEPQSIHQRDSHNKSVLHYCAAQNSQTGGDLDLVAAASIAVAAPELLESADEDGFTPLHLAVIQGNLAMVNLLLANKADVNAVDNEGHSVVHWATVCGEVEALRLVLQSGANVATPDINGGTPLHYAAQMCGACYEGKLGPVQSSKLALEILGILLAHPRTSVDVQDKDGRQPLLWAASAGSAKAVIALVKAGARVESADKDGLTALHCAASRGHTECLDTLISLCGAPTDLIDSNGCTALHYSVTLGHADATSRLLDLDADRNRQDRKGRTPSHCGCSKGQFETVKLLKERGANLWLRNAKGDLPVHEAASSGRRELVEWLLEQRPKQVNTTSNDGRSLLHIAATNDFTDMCKMLLDFGADINAVFRNPKGIVMTPLDCALQKGHRSTAKFLQSNGGLPAGKLRLAARRLNPFNEAVTTNAVRPLKYSEKEEIHDLRNSKKYVVYLKRSDSDGEAGGCSCTEQTQKKEQKDQHVCKRHERDRKRLLRRRTSSCGESNDREHSEICRSKSNIEIRRRKSRERYVASSSEWEDEEEENDEDSCENCCYHKRQKQRVLHRKISRSSSRQSKQEKDSEGNNEMLQDKEKAENQGTEELNDERKKEIEQKSTPSPGVTRPSSKSSNTSRPQSATRRRRASFVQHEMQDKVTEKESSLEKADVAESTEANDAACKVITTQVDVHCDANEAAQKSAAENVTKLEVSRETVEADVSMEVDQLLIMAATAVTSESKAQEETKPETGSLQLETNIAAETQVVVDATAEKALEKSDLKESSTATRTSTPQKQEKPTPTPTETPQLIETLATPNPTPTLTPRITSPEQTPSKSMPEEHETMQQSRPASAISKTKENVNAMESGDTTDNSTKKEQQQQEPEKPQQQKQQQEQQQQQKNQQPQTQHSQQPQQQMAPEQPQQQLTSSATEISSTAAADVRAEPNSKSQVEQQRSQESRRSFTLLPSDSAEDDVVEEPVVRKSSFQILPSDESVGDTDEHIPHDHLEYENTQVMKIVHDADFSTAEADEANADYEDDEDDEHDDEEEEDLLTGEGRDSPVRRFKGSGNRHGVGNMDNVVATGAVTAVYDYSNGRKRRVKKRVKSGSKVRSNWKNSQPGAERIPNAVISQSIKDHDSGFEPSPRIVKSKIPTPRHTHTAYMPRRPIYATLDGRSCASRFESRKPGDKGSCDMSAVTRSIQRNVRRYYMERKIFQHLLELKSLQIRSTKLNEAVLVKRAVDDYHKSCAALGGETGTRLRRYTFSEYTFKNFELFLYETLKALQKPGTYNFQNINEVYEEAERRLSPDYNAYEKALQCTMKTHRCLHAAHAYTGIPCAAYIPMMNHHTMPKFGFGPYKKSGVGSFYLPKILTSGGCGGKVALELSHGKSKQLISLPSEKLESNKRYFVTFTVKETRSGIGVGAGSGGVGKTEAEEAPIIKEQQHQHCVGCEDRAGK